MSYQQQLKEHYKAVRARMRMSVPRAAIVPAKLVAPQPQPLPPQEKLPPKNTEPTLRPGLLSEKAEKQIVKQALDATAVKRYEPFMGGRTRAQAERFADEVELSPKLPPLPGLNLEEQGGIRWLRVLHAVAKHHGVNPDEILGKSRKKEIISARFEVFYRLRVDVHMSYEKIAILMKRDHSSVLHGVYKMRDRLLDEQAKARNDDGLASVIHPLEQAHTVSL